MINPVFAESASLKIGRPAPDFRISSVQRDYFSLAELRSEGRVLLYFWSSRCHICHKLLTKVNALQVRYQKRGVTVAGINIGYESLPEVKKYLDDNHFGFLVLNDDAQKDELRKNYQIKSTPFFVLVSSAGVIEYIGHTIPDMGRFIPAPNLSAVTQ